MAPDASPFLAAAKDATGTIVVWSAILIAAALVGLWVAMWVRNYAKSDVPTADGPIFTLHDLKQMRRDGRLNEEEFNRARDKIIAQAGGAEAPPEEIDGPELVVDPPVPPVLPNPPDPQSSDGPDSR
jgi:hypothetical protein